MPPKIRDKPPLNCYKKQTSFLSFLIAIVVDIMNDNTAPSPEWRGVPAKRAGERSRNRLMIYIHNNNFSKVF